MNSKGFKLSVIALGFVLYGWGFFLGGVLGGCLYVYVALTLLQIALCG